MLIVQKYGGTSLAGMSRLRAAARRVTGLARQGNQVVVVVSAQGDTTDMLIEKATQVNRRGSAREMDAYLAAGAFCCVGYFCTTLTGVFLGQHRTIRQEVSARIFAPIQSSENGGILYVFPIFGTAEVGQKGG